MRTLGNIVWIVFGGLLSAMVWCLIGAVFYITIIGIPLGRQAFKMESITLTPFGRTIVYGGGTPSFLANMLWILLAGLWMALFYVAVGAFLCITVVGIPFGLQLFKMAKLSLMPFGAEVI